MPSASSASGRPTPPSGSLRILHVDDDATNRIVFDEVLSCLGHRPTSAASGAEALEALGRERFDLVIVDIHMPEMNGVELLARIRATVAEPPPVLAVTADVLTRAAPDFASLGFAGAVAKPLLFEPFGAVLAEVSKPPSQRRFTALGMKDA
jgi:CheY-like chemotaxis protein